MVNVWVFFRISGGLFNPAVTLGMVLVKAINVSRAILLVGAQITGGIFASFLVDVLFPTQFNVRTTLSPGTSLVRGVFIEALLTAELVFTIFMLAKEKHKATFIAPVGIGLALFIAELVGVFYTGGSLNPARSFGPCVVTGVWDQEHWIYCKSNLWKWTRLDVFSFVWRSQRLLANFPSQGLVQPSAPFSRSYFTNSSLCLSTKLRTQARTNKTPKRQVRQQERSERRSYRLLRQEAVRCE